MNRKLSGILVVSMLSLLPASLAAADGAALFKTKCAMCHSADGTGTTSMGKSMKLRDMHSADVQKQTDEELTKITADGKGKMPAFKGKLTDEEITSLVAHMRTLK